MTKGELKEHCKRQVECCEMWARNNGGEPHGKVYEEHKLVLDLINTLEQSGEDCVSREQAIKTISTDIQLNLEGRSGLLKYSDEIKDILKTLLDSQEKKLQALPPVTPTQRWIPVSESLPKENGLYQCTVILNDLPRTMELFYKNGKWLDNRRINMFDTYDIYGYGNTKEKHKISYQELISEFEWNQVIIAWQPLPRPYEEKRGNEND